MPPKIPIKMWSQNSSVLQGLPTTNNASEGWNSAFNATCTGNDIFWSTADRLIEEEGLAVTRWRQALTQVIFLPVHATFHATGLKSEPILKGLFT